MRQNMTSKKPLKLTKSRAKPKRRPSRFLLFAHEDRARSGPLAVNILRMFEEKCGDRAAGPIDTGGPSVLRFLKKANGPGGATGPWLLHELVALLCEVHPERDREEVTRQLIQINDGLPEEEQAWGHVAGVMNLALFGVLPEPEKPRDPLPDPLVESEFDRAQTMIEDALEPVIDHIQNLLSALEGRAFGSFAGNQRIAALIHNLVARLGMALACQKDTCYRPARLRCKKSGRSKDGSFIFEHQAEGRQVFHCGRATLPTLRLVRVD
jgi:hypothetical protein